jgi:energy-coupling factor transporter ATP-binding protein EcfA2
MEINKALIILEGPSQSGKTTSIRHLAVLLQQQYGSQTYKSKKWKECLEVHTVGNSVIGLTSRSDKFPVFLENIEFLKEEKNCNLIVCALNIKTKGAKEYISSLKNNNWKIDILHKYPDFCNRVQKDLQPILNSRASIYLLEKINQNISIENFQNFGL